MRLKYDFCFFSTDIKKLLLRTRFNYFAAAKELSGHGLTLTTKVPEISAIDFIEVGEMKG